MRTAKHRKDKPVNRLIIALGVMTAGLAASPAQAAVPPLNLVCGPGIEVQAEAGGPVYIDGKEAALTVINDKAYDAKLGDTIISIGINTDGTTSSFYTGPNRANGICNPAPGSTEPVMSGATIPFFNAECPGDISVHADEGGPVYLNGEEAEFKSFSQTYFEASLEHTTVSVTTMPDGSLDVSYTAFGGANGVCRLSN